MQARLATLTGPSVIAYRRARRRGAELLESVRTTRERDVRVERFALFVVVGYLVGWRSFAYVGIPQINLFIGETALVLAFVSRRTRDAFRTAVAVVTRPGRWHGLGVVVVALLGYGVVEFARGLAAGFDPLYGLKNLPFNYYVLLLPLGLWLGQRSPGLMQRFAWTFAVVNAVYGVAAVIILAKLKIYFPGSTDERGIGVPIFSIGTGSGMAILALLSYPLPARWRTWTGPLLLANAFVMLAEQQRAEWVGFTAALIVWALCTRRARTVLTAGVAVIGILVVVSLAGIRIPGAAGRGGEVSVAGVFGRVLAPVDPNAASGLVKNSSVYQATVDWRTTWWSAIWKSSNSSTSNTVLGHGYGYELRQLAPYVPSDTRTPHNVFFYALGYTGWVGVFLFGALWVALFRRLYRVQRITGNAFGLAFATVCFGLGLFGNWFEAPYGAAPTYFVVGLALAPLAAFAPAAVARAGAGRRVIKD